MTETQTPSPKKNININILVSTDEKLEELARMTFRTKGAVIDWLIDQMYTLLTTTSANTQQ